MSTIRGYNDFELLYLIKEHSDEALEIMFSKYEKLIFAKIHKYHFSKMTFEDMVQEGRLILLKAINKYNEYYNKTFTKYFEMLLEHRLIDLLRKDLRENEKYFLDEEPIKRYKTNEISSLDQIVLEEKINYQYNQLSSLEKTIYQLKFLDDYKVREIASELQLKPAQISNALQRIKQKNKNINGL